jgi:hypothetical protein
MPEEYDFQAPLADRTQIWRPGTGQDPARRLIPNHNLFHRRPSLWSGKKVYIWPIGVEGFNRSGQAALGIHRYIGDEFVDVDVVHRDEARIGMAGLFAGNTSVINMRKLIDIINDPTPEPGKILVMPGIFEQVQYVNVENFDFRHDPDDQTHSISYEITFVRTGVGRRAKDPKGSPPVPNPSVRRKKRGKAKRKIRVQAGRQTMKQMAHALWGNQNLWPRLLDLNADEISARIGVSVPQHQLPNYRFPIGTEFEV